MTSTKKRVLALIITVIMIFTACPVTAFAAIPNWEDNNVILEGKDFGTNGYYKVISQKDYVLVPGAAVESEIVLNNAAGTRRQVLHVIEVDPSNPDVSIVPGYYQIDQLAKDPLNQSNWSHQELTEMAKYYEDNLGYNIVGGMNTDLYYNSYSPRVLVYNGKSIGNFGNNSVSSDGSAFNPTSSILYVFKDAEGNISCDVKAFNKTDFENYLAQGVLLHAVGVSFGMTVKDGELVSKTEERTSAAAARSMVGVKEDGTLVICMNDGRGANNSVGFNNYELGESMLALGCKWAANCDGGGSSTFVSKRVGEEELTMRSVPCDGAQRPTAHGIFVASNVAPTGELDVVNVNSNYDILAPETVYTFGAEAIDTHGYSMDMPADATWALSDSSFGTIIDGAFVSNGKKGTVDVQVISGGKVVGQKTITVADPEVFMLSATSTVVPYSTADKVRTITLPIVAMTGEANVYVDTNAVSVTLSNEAAGQLDGFNFTATDDTSIAGVTVVISYGSIQLSYAIEFGKGSEIIFDFEDGDRGGFMGFEEAKKWSLDNDVNNTLVGSDPLAGQFNEYLSSETFLSTTTNGGKVRNGNNALAWRLDNTDAAFASWSYNVLFNVGETIVLRDVANGLKATTLGMWVYIPENAFPAAGKGLAFQSQLYVKNADGTYSCKQDHFMFTSASTGKRTNLNSATNADIPESRWVYMSIDISSYDYLCTPAATDESNSRSPSFIRTYVKPDTADEITFYIDDITLDYSSAVDDRVLPTISAPTYSTADTAVSLENGVVIVGNKIAFSATVADNSALDLTSGKIFVDGVQVKAAINGNSLSSSEDAVLAAGVHTVAFEVKDELGNPARITRTFSVAGDATVELSGHNDSGSAPKAQSIYYVDINVADLANVTKLVATLKLNNSNVWETKGAYVADGFVATFDYNEISELLTVTVEAVGVKGKALSETLVSIPVRIWTFDRYNYVNNTYYAPADLGNKPVVNVKCDVVYGEISLADKTTSPFGGAINVATELTTISSPYHVHDAELAVLNQEATTAEAGYENRTYCETCQSVVDWGTILPKLEITHNYEIVDGKFVCTDEGCGLVYDSGTGIFEMNGNLYYSIAGNLVTGWQDVGEGKRCFAYSNYQLAVGEAKVNGITYEFDENGGTYGAWVKDAYGTKFSYGPNFYDCSAAASPHANVAWAVILGNTYAFDKQGYRHEGISILVESNNPGRLYEFTDEGVLVGEYVTDHSGIFVCNNGTAYLENGTPTQAGLVYEDGYYYYINSGYRAVTGIYNVTRTNGLLPAGEYAFDSIGRMLNAPDYDNGVIDGVYYINGIAQKTWELFIWKGNYYFNKYYNVATNETVYLGAQFVEGFTYPNGDPMLPGYYNFDADGKMVIINGVVDGLYYNNGIIQKSWELFIWEGNYYFNKYYNVAANETVYLGAQFVEGFTYPNGDPMLPGYYNFDADGKMIIINGVVDGLYYKNGIVQKTWELFEWNGNYYFNKYYNVAADETVYLGAQFVNGFTYPNGDPMLPGYYNFDADGKMIILDGVYDGLYYKNGIVQKTWELFEWNGNYYFNKYYNVAADETVYLGAQFVNGFTYPDGTSIVPGYYNFDEDGKMIILNGVIDGLYYKNGIVQKTWELFKWEGNYYFNEYYKVAMNKTVYLRDEFLEGTGLQTWYYYFDADGKMVGHIGGVPNLRDFGDVPYIKTADGKDVKEGMLLRGPGVDDVEVYLTDEQAQTAIDILLNQYGIKYELDLRSTLYPELGVEDVFGDDVIHEYYGMVYYKDVFTAQGKEAIKNIFVALSNPDNYPIYMHCARGVDRTGIITYILGAMLGVPEGYLANEYMLSITAYGNDVLKVRDGMKNGYEGANLKECAEAFLLDCGVTQEQIESIRDILLED